MEHLDRGWGVRWENKTQNATQRNALKANYNIQKKKKEAK